MHEAVAVVSWEAPQLLGRIEGSDWVCPTEGLSRVADFRKDGGTVTDEILIKLAGGRRQHLERVQYPEGYDAAQIVDSESGEVRLEPKYTSTAASYAISHVLTHKPLDLGGGKQLISVENFYRGTQTIIAATGQAGPAAIDSPHADIYITPRGRALLIRSEGRLEAFGEGYGAFELQVRDSKCDAELAVQEGRLVDPSAVNVSLGPDGQVSKLVVYKRDLLDKLGVRPDLDFTSSKWAEVSDPAQRVRVLNALSEALGLGQWRGLDLKLTASGLYSAMGYRSFDPSTMLVPRY